MTIDTDTTDTSGGNITIAGDIIGSDTGTASNISADVVLDAVAATVSVKGIGHNTGGAVNDEINDVTLTGGTVKVVGQINTTGHTSGGNDPGAVTINGALELQGCLLYTSDAADE